MGSWVLLIAMLSVGYVAGVWTALLIFRQPQRAYEDGAAEPTSDRGSDPAAGAVRALELEG